MKDRDTSEPFIWINKWINLADKAGDIYINKRFRPYHINYTQFIILACIARNYGITQQDLSKTTLYDKGTVTRCLDHLEKQGYARRERDQNDRRIVRAYITQQGWDIFPSYMEIIKDWVGTILENLEKPFDLTDIQINQLLFSIATAAVKAVSSYTEEEFDDWRIRINWVTEDLTPPMNEP